MDWFGKSSKVERKYDMERLGITFETIQFHPHRNEYELIIHLPDCPKDLITLTYERPSGKLKLQGKKQKTEFLHRFPVPNDCAATGIYGRFRGDVLHVIMPRLFSDGQQEASSKQEDDQQASSDRKSTEPVGQDRENLPPTVPESLPSDQKSTDELTGGGGKDRRKSPARVLEPSPSVQKSTDKSTERGEVSDELTARVSEPSSSDQKSTEKLTERGKDRDKLPARVLSSSPQSDQETTEKLRQRDNELFPEISARQPSVRKPSSSVKELRENYQKNISKIFALPPPPPPPPTPRVAAPAPWNRKAIKIGSRKEEKEDRETSSDQKNGKQGDVEQENSIVKSQKKESKLKKVVSKNVEITLDNQGEIESEKPLGKSPERESKSDEEAAKNEKIVNESKAKENESEKKKPRPGGKPTLGMVVAKVKETSRAAVAAAKKEENRPMVIVGAAVLALVVIGASLRKKPKN